MYFCQVSVNSGTVFFGILKLYVIIQGKNCDYLI